MQKNSESKAESDKRIFNAIGIIHTILKQMNIRKSNQHYNDLIQAGVLGLVKADKTYNHKLSAFTTYAWWYVKNELFNYLSGVIDPVVNYNRASVKKFHLKTISLSLDYVSGSGSLNLIEMKRFAQISPTADSIEFEKIQVYFFTKLCTDVDLLEWIFTDNRHYEQDENDKYFKLAKSYFLQAPTSQSIKVVKYVLRRKIKKLAKHLIYNDPILMEAYGERIRRREGHDR